jgi:hypothetical protein
MISYPSLSVSSSSASVFSIKSARHSSTENIPFITAKRWSWVKPDTWRTIERTRSCFVLKCKERTLPVPCGKRPPSAVVSDKWKWRRIAQYLWNWAAIRAVKLKVQTGRRREYGLSPPPACMCELVPAFVIPNVDTVQSNEIENLER